MKKLPREWFQSIALRLRIQASRGRFSFAANDTLSLGLETILFARQMPRSLSHVNERPSSENPIDVVAEGTSVQPRSKMGRAASRALRS